MISFNGTKNVCNVYSVFGCVQVFLLLLLFFMDVFFSFHPPSPELPFLSFPQC